MSKHRVLRTFPSREVLTVGGVYDTTHWRNAPKLERMRYLEAVPETTPVSHSNSPAEGKAPYHATPSVETPKKQAKPREAKTARAGAARGKKAQAKQNPAKPPKAEGAPRPEGPTPDANANVDTNATTQTSEGGNAAE
jgi:hypothetical protein